MKKILNRALGRKSKAERDADEAAQTAAVNRFLGAPRPSTPPQPMLSSSQRRPTNIMQVGPGVSPEATASERYTDLAATGIRGELTNTGSSFGPRLGMAPPPPAPPRPVKQGKARATPEQLAEMELQQEAKAAEEAQVRAARHAAHLKQQRVSEFFEGGRSHKIELGQQNALADEFASGVPAALARAEKERRNKELAAEVTEADRVKAQGRALRQQYLEASRQEGEDRKMEQTREADRAEKRRIQEMTARAWERRRQEESSASQTPAGFRPRTSSPGFVIERSPTRAPRRRQRRRSDSRSRSRSNSNPRSTTSSRGRRYGRDQI